MNLFVCFIVSFTTYSSKNLDSWHFQFWKNHSFRFQNIVSLWKIYQHLSRHLLYFEIAKHVATLKINRIQSERNSKSEKKKKKKRKRNCELKFYLKENETLQLNILKRVNVREVCVVSVKRKNSVTQTRVT